MRKILVVILFFATLYSTAFAQLSVRDSSIRLFYVAPSYAIHLPQADLGDRFGLTHDVGVSINYKVKTNWIFGVNGSFFFGRDIKEQGLLSNIVNSDGYIPDLDGNPANLNIEQRGFTASLSAGKIFPWFGPNPNSGVRMEFNAGYIWHKIRIRDDNNNVPQLANGYLKGYDRLTAGFFTKEFIGYHFSSNNRKVNFFAGFEFGQGFTKSLRGFNYDTGVVDDQQRLDLLVGLRVGWMFLAYKRPPREIYFN